MTASPEPLVAQNPEAPPKPAGPPPSPNPAGGPTAVSVLLGLLVGVALFAVFVALARPVGGLLSGLFGGVVAATVIQAVRDGQRKRTGNDLRAARAAWDIEHRITTDQVPRPDLLRAVLVARAGLYATVTATDCLDESWRRVIELKTWALAKELLHSATLRADIDQGRKLAVGRPDLIALLTERSTEIANLDARLCAHRDELDGLRRSAEAIDEAFTAAERKRAEDDAAAAVLQRLAGTNDTVVAEQTYWHARAELAALAGNDLRILAAGLQTARERLSGRA